MQLYYYVQINIMCMLLLLGFNRVFKSKGTFKASQKIIFEALIVNAMLMCLSDVGVWLPEGNHFPGVEIILHGCNEIYFASITMSGFLWLGYVRVTIKPVGFQHKKDMIRWSGPLIIMMIIILINPWTGWLFTIDENNVYQRGDGIIVHWIISWGYLFTATFMAARELRREKSRYIKEWLRPLLWFVALPIVAAIAQMIFINSSLLQVGVTYSIVMITVSSLGRHISTDPLSSLNNRHALNRYISDQITTAGKRFTVMMCDVDDFKQINDSLGHAVGDLAIQRVADVLRKASAVNNSPMFICRYGGDEFLMLGTSVPPQLPKRLETDIMRFLEEKEKEKPLRCNLSISIGISDGTCRTEEDLQGLIQIADDRMYRTKAQRKTRRHSALRK